MTQTGTHTINLLARKAQTELHFGWTEWVGTKSAKFHVVFPTPFTRIPTIMLGLIGFENFSQNESFSTDSANTTSEGFDLILTVAPTNGMRRLDLQWLATDA